MATNQRTSNKMILDYPVGPVPSQGPLNGRGRQDIGEIEPQKDVTPVQCENKCLQPSREDPWEADSPP